MNIPWSVMRPADVARQLEVNTDCGLAENDILSRQKTYGLNALTKRKTVSSPVLFFYQFRDFMIMVLLAATLLSAVLGEYTDALVIIGIVLVNAMLGFVQEYKAEKSLEALREMTAPKARVLRGKQRLEIPAAELVPGDVVLLEAGDRIPADIRLFAVKQLSVNEASLTGESEPVLKKAEALTDITAVLGDLVNMAFMGTLAVGGRGEGIVVATGMRTEMGRVAHLIQQAENEPTPLQRRLEQMGKYLVTGCLVICALVVGLGLAQGLGGYKMLMAGVSLAVAAIPEGLPAVVTIALALGVQRMSKKNAIIRRLPAVETLGCATVICSDKTGTLTQNKMNVREIWSGGETCRVEGEGYSPQGEYICHGRKISATRDPALQMALTAAVLCNNARLRRDDLVVKPHWRGGRNTWNVQGDPTEGALLVAGARAGFWREDLEKNIIRVGEIPFDGSRKRMSVLYKKGSDFVLYLKGAPEIVAARCSFIYQRGKAVDFTPALREEVLRQNEMMAGQALRVLAVAYRHLPAQKGEMAESLEENLTFAGLFGMMDPPRPEVLPAILKCHKAGIKTVMITGDHKTTALAIAGMLRILTFGGHVLTGAELDRLNDIQLDKAVENCSVYARVTPEHKLRIVKALKRKGHIVAMTGDGVNDAPAVKEADIGIAMGKTGTDVTREAASLVLADDNFTSIVNAVEEGRGIYNNIRKFIRFLLACNTGEILTMLIALLAGLPMPLQAIQILWINLVTDGLPAMALGVDPIEKGIMNHKPRQPGENIFSRGLWQKILGRGVVIGGTTVLVFAWMLKIGMDLDTARTMAFSTLIITQLFYVFDCRSENTSVWENGLLGNLWLVAAVLTSFSMLIAVLYHPALAAIFGTKPLWPEQWLVILTASSVPAAANLIFSLVKGLFTQSINT